MPGEKFPIVLMTDFGSKDSYVGALKGAILSFNPNQLIVDLTHDIPPQNVPLAAFHLLSSFESFPLGTLFLAVIDPGVGSDRKILYAEAGGWKFISPDNGLLSWIFKKYPPRIIYDISGARPGGKEISHTFHGRDIMGPVGARILNGEKPEKWGAKISSYEKIPFPKVSKVGSQWEGEIIAVDSFGNLITNFLGKDVEQFSKNSTLWVELGSKVPPIRGLVQNYADVDEGRLMSLVGSGGFLEISARNKNASKMTSLKENDKISLKFRT